MKILWITNILFPAPCKELGIPVPVVGGWMYSSAKALLDNTQNLKLSVATVYRGDNLKQLFIDGITYYLLPLKGDNTFYHKELEPLWKSVKEDCKPDIVHIHGTEFAHGLAYINACGNSNVVVSIQGLTSVISQYYYSGMSYRDIIKNITFRDIFKCDTIFHQKRKMQRRGEIEKLILSKVSHIIGRTTWDKAHTYIINPSAKYHFCNETLRSSFYGPKWAFEKCERYSIFLSQAGYPIKGLHQVLKALNVVRNFYPNVHLYIAGNDITKNKTLLQKLKLSGYGKYIRSLISKYQLETNVTFTGPLSETEMVDQYLKSNLFICPSSIENSPNSLGEALILGIPSIASYVGGVPDILNGFNDVRMYRFEEWEMLYLLIIDSFKTNSDNMSNIGLDRYDSFRIIQNLLQVYNCVK